MNLRKNIFFCTIPRRNKKNPKSIGLATSGVSRCSRSLTAGRSSFRLSPDLLFRESRIYRGGPMSAQVSAQVRYRVVEGGSHLRDKERRHRPLPQRVPDDQVILIQKSFTSKESVTSSRRPSQLICNEEVPMKSIFLHSQIKVIRSLHTP